MQWRNTATGFGVLAKFFHWTTAAAFIAAYIVVYYVIWFMDDTSEESLPVLNIHWALGLLIGFLVLPRLLWRLLEIQPHEPLGSKLEHRLAHVAHCGLYSLMIVLPLTGYLGTGAPTDFGLFSVTGFDSTALFAWISKTFDLSYEAFEAPLDVVHHFLGKWVAWVVVALHIAAAAFHHWGRRDDVLKRMLPQFRP
ncbi:cytochrome b [Pseudomonas sp. SC11]|uniref:cytochrome b n=1 Tax=Pseudomonas sp. SC11 TaxID=326927 RepID=UPI00399B7E79